MTALAVPSPARQRAAAMTISTALLTEHPRRFWLSLAAGRPKRVRVRQQDVADTFVGVIAPMAMLGTITVLPP